MLAGPLIVVGFEFIFLLSALFRFFQLLTCLACGLLSLTLLVRFMTSSHPPRARTRWPRGSLSISAQYIEQLRSVAYVCFLLACKRLQSIGGLI